MLKSGHECDSNEEFLEQAASASECAQKCKAKDGCDYFAYGTKNTKCYWVSLAMRKSTIKAATANHGLRRITTLTEVPSILSFYQVYQLLYM